MESMFHAPHSPAAAPMTFRPSEGKSFFNPMTTGVIVLSLCAIGILQFRRENDPTGMSFLAMLAVIQLTPFLICLTRGRYNYFAFVMFNHFVTFSVAKYNQTSAILKVATLFPETITSIRELMLCSVIMAFGYYVCRMLFFSGTLEKQRFQLLSMTRRQMFFLSMYVITVPLTLQYIPANFLVIHFALSAADMLLLLCSNCPGYERQANMMKALVPVSTLAYFIETGFLSMAGQYGGFLFITSCLKKKYRTFVWLALLTVVVSMFQSVKADFRTFLTTFTETGYAEKLGVLGELIVAKYLVGEPEHDKEDEEDSLDPTSGIASGFDRIGDDSLERVLSLTPSKIPFWNGETYESIPYMFIPRFLWPEKPSRHFWNKYGRVYGVLSADDYQTSVGVGYLAEAYMNFGFLGMYIVALLFGSLLAAVERFSTTYLKGYFYFTYLVFLTPMLPFTNDLGTVMNSLFVIFVAMYLSRNILVRMARRDDYCDYYQ